MTDLKRLQYRHQKTDALKNVFLAAFRAIRAYEEATKITNQPHLNNLHYHLLSAVNNLDELLANQYEEILRATEQSNNNS